MALLARSAARPPPPRRSTALRRESAADPDEVESKTLTGDAITLQPIAREPNRPILQPVYVRRQLATTRRLPFP